MKRQAIVSMLLVSGSLLVGCSEGRRAPEPLARQQAALSNGKAGAELGLSSSWATGYCANVEVRNLSSRATAFWRVELDLRGSALTNIWGAQASMAQELIVTPQLYNAVLAPNGGSTSFGFCATRDSQRIVPLLVSVSTDAPAINPKPTASIRIDSDWTDGYCARVAVTNIDAATMYGWIVRVRLNESNATQLWNGSYGVDQGVLSVAPLAYNSTLGSKAETEFGFCAAKTGAKYRPEIVSDACPYPSDLSVQYLSHEPRFPLTIIDYDPPGYNPRLSSAAVAQRKWPDPGEMVTYRAHVENQGQTSSPAAGYRWLVDGVEASRGELPALAAGAAADPEMRWAFEDNDHLVRFELMSDECAVIDDGHVVNNAREQRTNAVLFTIYTWPGFESWMAAHDNAVGTRSAADWIQFEADEMNRLFTLSRSDVAPDGVRLRVGVDRIVRVPAETPYGGGHAPPEPCPTDSCWAFGGPEQHPDLLGWLENVGGQRDRVTMHEWGHQIGLLDVYNMDLQDYEVLLTDGSAGAATFSNSSAGNALDRLFDGRVDETIATYESRPVWFAVEFATPRRLDGMRMCFDGYEHQWQVVSSETLDSAIATTTPAVVRSAWIGTSGSACGDARFDAGEAKVWLVHVERLDGDRMTHVNEWELYDGETKLDVLGLTRLARVAGTPRMPYVQYDIVWMNSTYPYELMGGDIPYLLTPFHQWALNLYTNWEGRGLPLRRGWFGQYIANIPSDNAVLIRRNGVGLADAFVEVFQQQDNLVEDVVKYRGTTDASGHFVFPKVTTAEYAARYGLTEPLETPSPFSTIASKDPNVLGTNSVLVLRITTAGGELFYRFLDVISFNLEYARGHVDRASYLIDVDPAR